MLAPADILAVQVLHQLNEEQAEGLAVGDPAVDRVEHLTTAAHGRDKIDTHRAYIARNLVAAGLGYPATLSMVSPLDYRLVQTDHSQASIHGFNVAPSCILALEQCSWLVLYGSDGLEQAEGRTHTLAEEPA